MVFRTFMGGVLVGGASYVVLNHYIGQRQKKLTLSLRESLASIPGTIKEEKKERNPVIPYEHPYYKVFRETWNGYVLSGSKKVLTFFNDPKK